MSEIRLVRCPKCNKVLPEPHVFTVYQCGGCGAMLKAKKKSSESEKSGNSDTVSDKGVEEKEGFKDSGELRKSEGKRAILQEGTFDMDSSSPARSTFGDDYGRKSPIEETDFDEFHRGLPKSPMRERLLNDLSSSPVISRNVSPSPMRGRGSGDGNYDGVGMSPTRSRNVSKSPVRERGSKSPMSVRRTRNVSMSPLREANAVYRSPARTNNGDISNSPLREGFGSKFDESVEHEQEEGVRSDKMTPKSSFNAWLSMDNQSTGSNVNNLGRSRKQWRDQVADDADRISEGRESFYANEHGMTSEGSIDETIHGIDSSGERIGRDVNFRLYAGEYGIPRGNSDQMFTESGGDGVTYRNSRVAMESGRNSASSSAVDGPSSFNMDSIDGYVRSRHNFEIGRGPADNHYMETVEFNQNYQASMQQYPSQQLGELDDKLYSSPRHYTGGGDYSEEHWRYRRTSKQQLSPDNYMARHSYYNHEPGLVRGMEDTYNHPPVYDDPYAGQVRSARRPRQPQFSQHGMAGYVPVQSLDFERDSFMSYRKGLHDHHPADTYDNQKSSFGYRMPPNSVAHPTSSRSMNLQRPGPRAYDPRMAYTSPRERPSHLSPHHTRRVQVASQNKRLCLPIVGGSPFVLCHKCFELLKLPGKFMTKHKKEYQLQCGACSSIMSFDLQNRSLDVLSSEKKPDPVNPASGFGEVLNKPVPRRRHDSYTSTTLGSYDFDAMGNSFQSSDSEVIEGSRRQRLVSNSDEHTPAIFPSSRSSQEERVSGSASVRSSRKNSSELPLRIRPPPGSPLREHLDYSNHYLNVEAESARNYAEKEKQALEKDASEDSSVVNTAAASETEVYSHELPTSFSDSGDITREHKNESKDAQSSKSKSGCISPVNGEVYVNGQKVSVHFIKKAEKLAGPIQPGDYWYDPKAGFWGVMGNRCLGIIPPSIQEFRFPMPESCSGGDTAVYVNGRELQKRDLDLLASRGLPTTRGKRYIVDIFGKVLEELSKDFIVDLGKLAPTVEKNKRGFGMHVPEEFTE